MKFVDNDMYFRDYSFDDHETCHLVLILWLLFKMLNCRWTAVTERDTLNLVII